MILPHFKQSSYGHVRLSNFLVSSNKNTHKTRLYNPFIGTHVYSLYEIELAFDAIRGHKSAHSFATGPVMAEPEKQNEILNYTKKIV